LNLFIAQSGKETFSAQIARATNSMTKQSLDSEPIEEVKGILLVDSPGSLIEKDVEEFIKEDDDHAEPADISEFETPHRPSIKYEPLPACPECIVLNHDRDMAMNSHGDSLVTKNSRAMKFCEAPTLEFKEKDSIDEHGRFIHEIP